METKRSCETIFATQTVARPGLTRRVNTNAMFPLTGQPPCNRPTRELQLRNSVVSPTESLSKSTLKTKTKTKEVLRFWGPFLGDHYRVGW